MPLNRTSTSRGRDEEPEERTERSGRSRYDDRDEHFEDDRRDDYEEERRPRGRARTEEPEDDRPSRRRSDDDRDERPARGRRTEREDDDRDQRPTRSRSRDEEPEERPARGRRRDNDEPEEERAPRREMKSGWSAAERAQANSANFAQTTKLSSDEVIFKFLDDEPFVVFGQHWINELKGKKSFVCANDPTEAKGKSECPLCDVGDSVRVFSCFNVLRMLPGQDPLLEVLQAASRLTTTLKDKNASQHGPLSKGYWALSSSGKGTNTTYNMAAAKERDLEHDWDIVPLDDRELEDCERDRYDSSTFPEQIPSRRDLKDIADEITR